jgi:hypothetical protein
MEKTIHINEIISQIYHVDLKEQLNEWIKVRDFKELMHDLPMNDNKNNNKLKV